MSFPCYAREVNLVYNELGRNCTGQFLSCLSLRIEQWEQVQLFRKLL